MNMFYSVKQYKGYWVIFLPNNLKYVESASASGVCGKEGTWCYVHRMVACLIRNREVTPVETVGFINGDKTDCNVSNLYVTNRTSLKDVKEAGFSKRIENFTANVSERDKSRLLGREIEWDSDVIEVIE